MPQAAPDDYRRAAAALGEAAELAATFGVRLALEFQKIVAVLRQPRHDAGPDRAVRRRATPASASTSSTTTPGRASSRTWRYLTPENLAWVQVCDLSGTPRELAGDGDRILPGDGDFQLGPIVDHLGRIGYDGYVSLEVLNPQLWQVVPIAWPTWAVRRCVRVLAPWESGPSRNRGGP